MKTTAESSGVNKNCSALIITNVYRDIEGKTYRDFTTVSNDT